ncbi:hypothetical protein SAMN05661012_04328 [Chitinophaga sancti]|uniref:Uncharacterized protein n=1 Tax=Chitinophaga sancti TaxID=1004 RepID=A0A1K1RWJ5_9BACT|nr:hypothetical protein SAMN05661012_04328 [Chitinophaga sancti]
MCHFHYRQRTGTSNDRRLISAVYKAVHMRHHYNYQFHLQYSAGFCRAYNLYIIVGVILTCGTGI